MTATALGASAASRMKGAWPLPLLLAALVAAPLMFAPQLLNDGDSFWHVAAGEWMLAHGAVVHVDTFSHSVPGRGWTAHEWLSEVLMALAYRAAGWAGVMTLVAGAAGLLTAILVRYLRRWSSPAATVIALLLVIACLPPSLLARPHVLAWPLMAAWTVGLLEAVEAGRRPSLWLLPLMAVWANLHGSFVLGLALVGVLALDAVTSQPGDRRRLLLTWAGFAGAAVIAACATPHGLHGLVFPFQLMGMQATPGIDEWRAADFSRLGGFEIALLAIVGAIAWRGVKVAPVRLVLILGLLHLALQHARHQPVAAILTALVLARPFGSAQTQTPAPARPRAAPAILVALAGAVVLRLATPQSIGDGLTTPVTALGRVPAALRATPVFNEYGFGGYLVHEGVRPFIDGRADMYGDGFIAAYDRAVADPADLQTTLDRYAVRWTILAPSSPAVAGLDRSPAWRRLWSDPYAVVHVRR